MRPIDADGLTEVVKELLPDGAAGKPHVLDAINYAPTLQLPGLPERAYWKPTKNGAATCSKCGRRFRRQGWGHRDMFCPQCGRQMYAENTLSNNEGGNHNG
jgi:hypothetical protein